MRLICLALSFFFGALQAQKNLPYFVPKSETVAFKQAYILRDDEECLEILRLNESRYEWIRYPKNDSGLCAVHCEAAFYAAKKNRLIFPSTVEEHIVKNDSLCFAVVGKESSAAGDAMSALYFKKNLFYASRLLAFFKVHPVLVPTLDPRAFNSWSVSPETGNPFVQGPCSKPDNLDCLCSALTYNQSTTQEKADAIGRFVIHRFNYRRGDTAQTNIKGLVFGKELEAVCEGYSRVYKDLMERSGFKTDYLTGAIRTDVYDIFYSGHSHAWNQTKINDETYALDITWANNLSDMWYLMPPKDFQVTHFIDPNYNKPTLAYDSTFTMYDFMHQPLINPIQENGAQKMQQLDKTLPFYAAKNTFVINFSKKMTVNSVSRQELSYPFVKFSGESGETATKVIAKSGKITNKTSTNRLEIILPEKINNIQVEIAGIGTIHYVVFNGSDAEFYQFLVDQKNPNSAHSMALAFLACAKLNDPAVFSSLKSYLPEDLSFKKFMKQAKDYNVDEFSFATFNASQHSSYSFNAENKLVKKKPNHTKKGENESFFGYSFEYSQPHKGKVSKIFLHENEDNTFSFAKFNINSW